MVMMMIAKHPHQWGNTSEIYIYHRIEEPSGTAKATSCVFWLLAAKEIL